MAGEFKITKTCRRCDGSGAYEPKAGGSANGSCDRCGGSGTLQLDFIDLTELMEELADLKDKLNDIKELLTTA